LEERRDVLSELLQTEGALDEFRHLVARWLLTVHFGAGFLDTYPSISSAFLAKAFHLSPAVAREGVSRSAAQPD
jgi:hypothetical protein